MKTEYAHFTAGRVLRWAVFAGMLALAGLLTVLFRGAETGSEDESRSREDLIAFLSMPAEEQFRPVVPGYAIEFPRDHGPHPDFRQEWWYFTGRLESPAGRVFGYQLTFFRFRTGGAGVRPDSAWSSDQSWMAHLALTDVDGERFTAREDFARGALGLAGAEAAPLAIWVNGWSARATGRNEACDGCFTARLTAGTGELALDLVVEAALPPVLQGDRGYSVKTADERAASYYYSMPGLSTRGTVRLGEEIFSVRGQTWMDREWSSAVLAPGQSGWDWFSLNLDNGYRLVIFQVREAGNPPYLSAALLDPANRKTSLDPGGISLEPTGYWTAPGHETTYPVAWRLRADSPEVPWALTVTPAIDDQVMDMAFRYYEGLVNVDGTWNGAPVSGWGYMELTGY